MNFFYLYVFILLSFIVAVSYLNTYLAQRVSSENFNSSTQTFILLGDSVFKNDTYVSDGKSVDSLLKERTGGKTLCLAVDNSKIVDIYGQIDKIPEDFNNNSTTIFLSVGGNDILNYYLERKNDIKDSGFLEPMFKAYKKLIESIRTKFPNANIVILDIYYPNNMTYKQYHPIIDTWNKLIYEYAREPKNNISSVLKISNILTHDDEFSFGIEPSETGSKKLVETILISY
jgi:hypothetical protein